MFKTRLYVKIIVGIYLESVVRTSMISTTRMTELKFVHTNQLYWLSNGRDYK